jgi:hypothetical protein
VVIATWAERGCIRTTVGLLLDGAMAIECAGPGGGEQRRAVAGSLAAIILGLSAWPTARG